MLRNIRPHSLGIVAAAIAQPSDSQLSSTEHTSTNNNVHSYAESNNDSDRKAKASSKEESTRASGKATSSEREEKKRTDRSQRATTSEAKRAAQDAENGLEQHGSTVSKFEVIMFNACSDHLLSKLNIPHHDHATIITAI